MIAVLSERMPAVIAVCGSPGMGKTSLLRAFRDRAVTRGWVVAGGRDDGRIAIGAGTQRQDFVTAVLDRIERSPEPGADAHPEARGPDGPMDPFVAELARRAPLVIVVDDYRPGPLFADWFERTFLPGVKSSGAPLVIAAAQRARGRRMDSHATRVIELSALDALFVRDRLLEIEGLEPPLTPDELDVYAREADSPLLVDSLLHVLSLAAGAEARR